jgi:hypothetical protein
LTRSRPRRVSAEPRNIAWGENEAPSTSTRIRQWGGHSKAVQLFKGVQIDGFTITSDAPVRDVHGILRWGCQCPAGHAVQVPHTDLTYGIRFGCITCNPPSELFNKSNGVESFEQFADWITRGRVRGQNRKQRLHGMLVAKEEHETQN